MKKAKNKFGKKLSKLLKERHHIYNILFPNGRGLSTYFLLKPGLAACFGDLLPLEPPSFINVEPKIELSIEQKEKDVTRSKFYKRLSLVDTKLCCLRIRQRLKRH